MADVKVTKKMVLEAIQTLMEQDPEGMVDDTVSASDVLDYVHTTLAQLDAKAVKAKERAAKTKEAGDELRAVVERVITDELQSIDVITIQVQAIEGYEDVTKSKVTARLTQLVKAGAIHKEQVKTVDGRKVMAYALGAAPENEDAE